MSKGGQGRQSHRKNGRRGQESIGRRRRALKKSTHRPEWPGRHRIHVQVLDQPLPIHLLEVHIFGAGSSCGGRIDLAGDRPNGSTFSCASPLDGSC